MTSARSSRDAILAAVRAARPSVVPLPAMPERPEPEHDLTAAFVAAAQGAGAHVIVGDWADVARLATDAIGDAAQVLSLVPDVAGTVRVPDDPHALDTLDVFVARGTLGVAENGAVWLPASRLGQRAGLFLATRVVLVLDRDALVADFHAAYARLDVAAEPFGAFVAGPSKTADIEQSLVVGAHGPKALAILLLGRRATFTAGT